MDTLRIGELAEIVGVNPRTIRYYESIGILPEPRRAPGGFRIYAEEDILRLQLVRGARSLMLSLDDIRPLVAATERGLAPADDLSRVLDSLLDQLEVGLEAARRQKSTLLWIRQESRRLADAGGDPWDALRRLAGGTELEPDG